MKQILKIIRLENHLTFKSLGLQRRDATLRLGACNLVDRSFLHDCQRPSQLILHPHPRFVPTITRPAYLSSWKARRYFK